MLELTYSSVTKKNRFALFLGNLANGNILKSWMFANQFEEVN